MTIEAGKYDTIEYAQERVKELTRLGFRAEPVAMEDHFVVYIALEEEP